MFGLRLSALQAGIHSLYWNIFVMLQVPVILHANVFFDLAARNPSDIPTNGIASSRGNTWTTTGTGVACLFFCPTFNPLLPLALLRRQRLIPPTSVLCPARFNDEESRRAASPAVRPRSFHYSARRRSRHAVEETQRERPFRAIDIKDVAYDGLPSGICRRIGLKVSSMLLIMSYMKTVTLRDFKHHSRYQRMAHDGEPILVTHRGKPYFVALPPGKASTFLGAARGGKPLTS